MLCESFRCGMLRTRYLHDPAVVRFNHVAPPLILLRAALYQSVPGDNHLFLIPLFAPRHVREDLKRQSTGKSGWVFYCVNAKNRSTGSNRNHTVLFTTGRILFLGQPIYPGNTKRPRYPCTR